jgi:hypothetical protein
VASRFTKGATVRVTGTFRNAAGALADPSTVTFKYRIGQGATTTRTYPATIIRDSMGVYHVDLAASTSGTWWYRWESTGDPQTSVEVAYFVTPTRL